MLGDSLLVSPVMDEGQTQKAVYLPPGKWFDYRTDRPYDGGSAVTVETDSKTWGDLPMFVRSGSIVATQPVLQFAAQKAVSEITLDVWPDATREATFDVYDDDGETYGYEHGNYFSQRVTASKHEGNVNLEFHVPIGSYQSSIQTFRVRFHGSSAQTASWNNRSISVQSADGVSQVVVPAGEEGKLTLR
jgi:alpha-glucosidase